MRDFPALGFSVTLTGIARNEHQAARFLTAIGQELPRALFTRAAAASVAAGPAHLESARPGAHFAAAHPPSPETLGDRRIGGQRGSPSCPAVLPSPSRSRGG